MVGYRVVASYGAVAFLKLAYRKGKSVLEFKVREHVESAGTPGGELIVYHRIIGGPFNQQRYVSFDQATIPIARANLVNHLCDQIEAKYSVVIDREAGLDWTFDFEPGRPPKKDSTIIKNRNGYTESIYTDYDEPVTEHETPKSKTSKRKKDAVTDEGSADPVASSEAGITA